MEYFEAEFYTFSLRIPKQFKRQLGIIADCLVMFDRRLKRLPAGFLCFYIYFYFFVLTKSFYSVPFISFFFLQSNCAWILFRFSSVLLFWVFCFFFLGFLDFMLFSVFIFGFWSLIFFAWFE